VHLQDEASWTKVPRARSAAQALWLAGQHLQHHTKCLHGAGTCCTGLGFLIEGLRHQSTQAHRRNGNSASAAPCWLDKQSLQQGLCPASAVCCTPQLQQEQQQQAGFRVELPSYSLLSCSINRSAIDCSIGSFSSQRRVWHP
jgi:hypothetical protein